MIWLVAEIDRERSGLAARENAKRGDPIVWQQKLQAPINRPSRSGFKTALTPSLAAG